MSRSAGAAMSKAAQVRRIMRVLRPGNGGGPRKRTVIEGLGSDALFLELLESGKIVRYGSKRGTKYGLPRAKR